MAACELVFLTVPDDAIEAVAGSLRGRSGQAVVHCSGGLSLEPLATIATMGVRVGSFHPLQAFAQPVRPEPVEGHDGQALRQAQHERRESVQQEVGDRLAGITYGLEGPEPLISTLEDLARDLGGRPIRLPPGSKALYHASAVLASNYLVTLAQQASDLWAHYGVPRDEALTALLPLIEGTVANLNSIGLPDALTGPIARGDVGTVRRHLEVLAASAPDAVPLYRKLGSRTVPIGRAKGTLAAEAAEMLKTLLTTRNSAKEEPSCV